MERIIATIWNGWNVTASGIYSPEGLFFTPADLRARQYDKALIAELQCQIRLTRKKMEVKKNTSTSNVIDLALARKKRG